MLCLKLEVKWLKTPMKTALTGTCGCARIVVSSSGKLIVLPEAKLNY
jgi:hypothetical protein